MRQDIELTSFAKGELSPRLKGRTDYKGYYDGCDTLMNQVVMPQGGTTRRPGTLYSAHVKTQSAAPKLVRFQFSITQAYMLEFGAGYIRVYRDQAPVINELTVTGAANNGAGLIRLTVADTTGLYDNNTAAVAAVGGVPNATGTWLIDVISGTTFDLLGSTFAGVYTTGGTAEVIVEIPTIYSAADIEKLSFTQSADLLYLATPLRPIYTLARNSHSRWVTNALTIFDGPYTPTNTTATTITPSGTTGSVTLTASSTTGINANTGFQTTDIGRAVRLLHTNWGWAIITAWTSTTVVTAFVQNGVTNGAATGFGAATPTAAWKLGKWSDTTGFPWLITFWQQRFFAVGTNTEPNAIEGGQIADYQNFAPTKADGTVIDVNAVSWIMADQEVNAARWVSGAGSAVTPQLGVGTDASEHVLQAGGSAQALTPTSVQAYRETSLGAKAQSSAVRINKAVLFAGFSGRKLYEWVFNWQVNGYVGTDKTVEAEHITRGGGILDVTYQKSPYGVVWCRREDGGLIGMTYLPEQEVLAWHQHELGGDYYGSHPVVESIACMPSQDASYDELWLAIKRTINGSVVRTIEVMTAYFDDQLQEDAVFMDSSIQSELTFPAATLVASAMTGSGVTFTASGGTPFVSGNVGSVLRYNGGVAQITGFTSTTVLVGQWYRDATSLEPQTVNNWSLTEQFDSFSNLTHLVGQTVQILGDGADLGTQVVDGSGEVELTAGRGEASYATVGLPYLSRLVSMPWATQSAPSGQGRFKTIATLWIRMMQSLGCNVGRKVTDPMTQQVDYVSEPLQIRSAEDFVGFAPPLFTGLYRLPLQGSHDMEGQILVDTEGPYPLTVLALVATGDVGEMAG